MVLAGAAALGGCSVLPKYPYQERREWPLDVARPEALPPAPAGPILLIRPMRAGPGLDTRGLRLRRADGSETTDYWEEWAVPPPQGVEDDLRQWLAASGIFRAVVQPGSEVTPALTLDSELLAFVGDVAAGSARVSVSVVLLRDGRDAEPVLQRSFTGVAPLTGESGQALAASLRAAVAVLMGSIERALRGMVG
jgi:ABC-type uncharacterized transport system auxiliary subunit